MFCCWFRKEKQIVKLPRLYFSEKAQFGIMSAVSFPSWAWRTALKPRHMLLNITLESIYRILIAFMEHFQVWVHTQTCCFIKDYFRSQSRIISAFWVLPIFR